MSKCGCKYYGNQHGSYIRFCDVHEPIVQEAARVRHQSMEKFVNQAVSAYARRIIRQHRLEGGT